MDGFRGALRWTVVSFALALCAFVWLLSRGLDGGHTLVWMIPVGLFLFVAWTEMMSLARWMTYDPEDFKPKEKPIGPMRDDPSNLP
ncbi:hypothetical protein EON82_11680 [bacterium]|nr:MAG: hypothetical protein EON82_11680 [bacterium]